MRRISRFPLLIVIAMLAACGGDDGDAAASTTAAAPTTAASTTTAAPTTSAAPTTTTADAFELSSSAFDDGGVIPVAYTCDGDNLSPPLEWGGNPEGTAALALLMDDPDAGTEAWVHWVLFNIPPGVTSLPEGIPGGADDEVLPDGSIQGINDFGVLEIADFNQIGWDGPCPPDSHAYVFRLLALDTMLDLEPGATLAEVEAAAEGHVLEESTLIGDYPGD